MARTLYGFTGGDIIAKVDAEGDFVPSSSTFEAYTTRTGATQLTDLQTYTGAATSTISPNTDENGRILFYGPDPYTAGIWLKDTANPSKARWLVNPIDLADRGGLTVNGVTPSSGNVSLTQDNVPDGTTAKQYTATEKTKLAGIATGANLYTDAQARTAVGIPTNDAAATLAGDNAFTGANTFPSASIPASTLSGLDTRFDNYIATKGIPMVRTFANGTTPAVTPNTLWLELGSGVTGTPAASLVTHNASTLDGSTFTFTLDNTMPSAAIYVAFVHGGTATVGATVAIAASMTGRSVTWSKIGTGTNSGNGGISQQMFKGVGTPAADGDMSVTFPSSVGGCHLEIVAVTNVSSTVASSAYTAGIGVTTPTVSLGAAPSSTAFQLFGLGINATANTVTADPGIPLGTTPDITSGTPSMATRASYRTSAQQTSTWTKSATAQYTAATVVLTPA